MAGSARYLLLVAIAILVLLPAKADAFGAGNIASISKIEGKNWRHGDIEDMLATVACIKGHKWKSMMIKGETIRVLVWILSFMSFGYATGEFEVTAERLGTYRPEEHIDNPKDYADNEDARKYDPRLRGPVSDAELAVDPNTGMKNYIANEQGPWATSAGYVRYSLSRAIHFGRMYTHGPSNQRGREEDLCEALRCLGQALHCLEDYGAHTNYTELVLRELGYHNVFPHVGTQAGINLRGKHVFPLVTGTFGGVDFFHSVLGEATDHISSAEIDQMDTTLSDALTSNTKGSGSDPLGGLTDILSKVPGTGGLVQEAQALQASSDAQASANAGHGYRSGGYDSFGSRAGGQDQFAGAPPTFDAPPGSVGGPPGPNIPGTDTDPATIIPKIYPILVFRDKVVRNISEIVSKIPGLEKLIDTITERVTLFVLSLLAPFVLPIIKTASAQLKTGSSAVLESSAKHQFDVWNNPTSTDPTHSMLSKDHFSNVLNEPAGQVAVQILQYVVPRVMYAFDHPDVPVDQVLNDCVSVFHHPALRDSRSEVQNNMFRAVKDWAHNYHGKDLNDILSSESVKAGRNHKGGDDHGGHGAAGLQGFSGHGSHAGHSHGAGSNYNFNSSHQPSSSSSGGLLGGLTSALPGGLGSAFSSFGKRDGSEGDFSAPAGSAYTSTPSAAFQPYQSSYDGSQPYQTPAEYANAQPVGGYGWGEQQFASGQVHEPSYSVPTGYQQGYESYQNPAQQGGYQYDQGQNQGQGGGRQWGAGGGNSAW
ncbi:hypothetical protein N0V86_004231 [Didymella sp. IMI 355093]|nr:hypothetical protein N0V86_004231 [Didymella sp. IMI 355093]